MEQGAWHRIISKFASRNNLSEVESNCGFKFHLRRKVTKSGEEKQLRCLRLLHRENLVINNSNLKVNVTH
jgi:hypothetical protein